MSDDKQVTMHGNPLNLVGEAVAVGQAAPDAELVNNDLAPVKISDYLGKVVVISVVPSLDTPVCDLQTRRFNSVAANLGGDVVILTISMDLPFAQKRWCGAAGADAVVTLSDHREAAFGLAYGLLIKELRLLARAVLVLDREGKITYIQRVLELTNEPDYDEALAAVKDVV
ncbi:MAG: thiol peroxidase [Proteobacteria bacterium]|nr:thiol peroxidase [Pseudomonadota bacterium]